MKNKKLLIIIMLAVIICSSVILTFNACATKNYTPEEHLERIKEKCDKWFLGDDERYNTDYIPGEKNSSGEEIRITGYDAYLVKSFDGTLGYYFIVEYQPSILGYSIGLIIKNEYYLIVRSRKRKALTPFAQYNIEPDNRYLTCDISTSHDLRGVFATMIDGKLTDTVTGKVFDEEWIKRITESEKKTWNKRSHDDPLWKL